MSEGNQNHSKKSRSDTDLEALKEGVDTLKEEIDELRKDFADLATQTAKMGRCLARYIEEHGGRYHGKA